MKKESCCLSDFFASVPIYKQSTSGTGRGTHDGYGNVEYRTSPKFRFAGEVYADVLEEYLLNKLSTSCKGFLYALSSTPTTSVEFTHPSWKPKSQGIFFNLVEFSMNIPQEILRGITKIIKEHVPKTNNMFISITTSISPESLCFYYPEEDNLPYINAFGKFTYSMHELVLTYTYNGGMKYKTLILPKELQKERIGIFKETLGTLRIKGQELL